MQDRYVGDIGDYVKLSILRVIMPRRRLGVAWWLFPDETHNSDGRHIAYLDQADRWRGFDPDLFDRLRKVVTAGERRVEALQHADVLPGAVYCDDRIPTGGTFGQRILAREQWLQRVKSTVNGCDLVFIDPDNGLETKRFKPGAPKACKSVSLGELQALRSPERTLIVYHHQTRMKGGHRLELAHWGERLRRAGFLTVDALRASAYSARAFFLLDAPQGVRHRAEQVAARWGQQLLTWHPQLGSVV